VVTHPATVVEMDRNLMGKMPHVWVSRLSSAGGEVVVSRVNLDGCDYVVVELAVGWRNVVGAEGGAWENAVPQGTYSAVDHRQFPFPLQL